MFSLDEKHPILLLLPRQLNRIARARLNIIGLLITFDNRIYHPGGENAII
jgi:hypothetical protein